jgi:hypothetical protein
MSLTPETTPTSEARETVPQRQKVSGLRRRIWVVLFALLAFEIGTFLVVFPWMDSWSLNHFPTFFPGHVIELQDLWDDPYFRGSLSCLGLLNVYIALRESLQLVRSSKQH